MVALVMRTGEIGVTVDTAIVLLDLEHGNAVLTDIDEISDYIAFKAAYAQDVLAGPILQIVLALYKDIEDAIVRGGIEEEGRQV